MAKVWKAVCHDRWWTHVDEMMAILLIQLFGQDRFPGLELRNTLVLGKDVPVEQTNEQYEAEGLLLIGLGKGRFDDHKEGGKDKDKSAAMLVAEELGVLEKYPVLGAALEWTNRADVKRLEGIGDVAYTLLGFEDPLDAIEYFELSFKVAVNYRHKTKYARSSIDAYRSPHKQTLMSVNRTRYRFKVVEPPDGVPSLAGIAFGREGEARQSDQVDWIVQIYPTGHVSIRANHNRSIDLESIYQSLVEDESKKQTGTIWHRERQRDDKGNFITRTIVNGGTTHACIVPATLLSVDELVEVFKTGINRSIIKKGGKA